MPSSSLQVLVLAASLLGFTGHAFGTGSENTSVVTPTTPAAVFQDSSSSIDGQFVFAVNGYNDSLYLHMSAPSAYQWMGVGVGHSMDYTLMWIAYPNRNGTGMTLSTRLATGHHEPSYSENFHWGCEQISGDGSMGGNSVTSGRNGTMSLNAVCRGVLNWNNSEAYAPAIQKNNSTPFIYAIGPRDGYGNHGSRKLRSDSSAAGLNMHSYHGSFSMQMESAWTNDSSAAGIPKPNGANGDTWTTENVPSYSVGPAKKDYDPAPAIHGFVMCLAFVVVFPTGVLVRRLAQRVIIHAWVQTIGFVLVCMASAGGIVVSTKYFWAMHLISAHQVIGILVFIALAVQFGLGIAHHRIYQKKQRPTLMGKIHKYLGPATMLAGLINAPLGFVLAGNAFLCLMYFGLIIVVALIFGITWSCVRRGRQQRAVHAPIGGSGEYQYSQFGPPGKAHDDEALGTPPAYGRSRSYEML